MTNRFKVQMNNRFVLRINEIECPPIELDTKVCYHLPAFKTVPKKGKKIEGNLCQKSDWFDWKAEGCVWNYFANWQHP